MTVVRRIASIAIVALPPSAVAVWAIRTRDSPSATVGWAALAVAFGASLVVASFVESALQKRLRTISAVLSAYREGDFSIRARSEEGDAALREVLNELNQLGEVLRSHRLGELEAWSLLRKVMAEVDVVVLAIDDNGTIRLANGAASRMLGRSSRELLGASASSLGLSGLLEGAVPRIVSASALKLTAGEKSGGPWELRRGTFRLSGEQQTLLVLSDVSRALRDNERDAWRRLIRVMGHEINNSLSPIKSISDSLVSLTNPANRESNSDWETDLRDGLNVIARRSEALNRFMASYSRLARLPPPHRTPTNVATLVKKIVALETRAPVEVRAGPDVTLNADADQLEQVLINLVKNAAEASLEGGTNGSAKPGVRVGWELENGWIVFAIEDDGPGVGETANLFVPFFTTKRNGSGIGLVLSRQIVEAHDGQLSLESRPNGHGAIARIRIPATS